MNQSQAIVAAVAAQLKNADQSAIEAAIAKAESEELAAFVAKHLRPVIEISFPAVFGVNAGKSHPNFGNFLCAASNLVAGKLISDAIREVGRD